MSWLFFIDESGHDHKQCPYEVRGGIALHTKELWRFVKAMQWFEVQAFGCRLAFYGKELKGCTLLNRKRYKFAQQGELMSDSDRQKHARAFLEKSQKNITPSRDDFTAYGQACIYMAQGLFQILDNCSGVILASIIPGELHKPDDRNFEEYLRKDHVFLLERYFYMLEEKQEHGLLVMDEVEKHEDQCFVRCLERYFTLTDKGQYRASLVVPSPFFVSSDMTYAIQAADICIYVINWGYRLQRMDKPARQEISEKFDQWLRRLQYKGTLEDEACHQVYGIVYISDPYTSRK